MINFKIRDSLREIASLSLEEAALLTASTSMTRVQDQAGLNSGCLDSKPVIAAEDIIAEFENGKAYLQTMAKFVKKLLLDGYELSHAGAAATLSFWTVWHVEYSIDHDQHYLRSICTWDVKKLSYGGLCSHNPITKGLTGYGLSAEALAIKKERRAQQVTAAVRRYLVKEHMLEQLVAHGELKPDHPDAVYVREWRERTRADARRCQKTRKANVKQKLYDREYAQMRRREVAGLYDDDKQKVREELEKLGVTMIEELVEHGDWNIDDPEAIKARKQQKAWMTDDQAVIAKAGESAKVLEQVADGTLEEDDPRVAEARACLTKNAHSHRQRRFILRQYRSEGTEDKEVLADLEKLRKIQTSYYSKRVLINRKNRNLAAMFRQGLLDDKIRKKQDWRRKQRRDLGRLWEQVLQSKMSIKDLGDVSPEGIAKAKDAYEWVLKKRASSDVRTKRRRAREKTFRQQIGIANRKPGSKRNSAPEVDSDDEPLPRPGLRRVVNDTGGGDDDEPPARPRLRRHQTGSESDGESDGENDGDSDDNSDDQPLPPQRTRRTALLRQAQLADDGEDYPSP
ncbi:hypothetical protein PV11_00605 [Exophiala sideris]|uniref:Uncharacterized protein n=1 Tax=Exophiala sideris TaxID=1016849 RepID=A0A0D1YPY3_9EURO|nr:hypothetical protein PV11_00605 [Exophiala sideris]